MIGTDRASTNQLKGSRMKFYEQIKLLFLLFLASPAYAQIGKYMDYLDDEGGSPSGAGGLIILGAIAALVLIFGDWSHRLGLIKIILFLAALVGYVEALGILGRYIAAILAPTSGDKIRGLIAIAVGSIGFFGPIIWYIRRSNNKDS